MESIKLIGADDVYRAASLIEVSLARHQIFLDEWLIRLEYIMKDITNNYTLLKDLDSH